MTLTSDLNVEIQKRLKWELVLKSTTASPAIAALAFALAYYRFGISHYRELVLAMMLLCGSNTVFRFFVGRSGIQGNLSKARTTTLVNASLVLNSILWTCTFFIVFLQVEPASLHFTIAFMISITLLTASVLTLSYQPALAIFYQLGLLSGTIYAFVQEYLETSNQDFLLMLFCMLLLAFYSVRQTLDYYRQMLVKYKYEVELEFSLEQLKFETARAENASRLAALGDIAGGMAHEINTPLAIINLLTEESLGLLSSGAASNADLKTKMESVLTASRRISRIIKSLLQISRRGQDIEAFANIKVEELLQDVLNVSHEKFAAAGINFEVAPYPEILVQTNQVLISQVLLNLLSNAFDQLSDSRDAKFLKIYFRTEKDKLVLCIENSGPKISPENQEKLFLPFFTTKEIGKGTGLGLSVCKGIIESLKEQIWLDKTKSNTTFCLSLPIVS